MALTLDILLNMKRFVIKDRLSNQLENCQKQAFYQFIDQAHQADLKVGKQVEDIIAKTRQEGDKALISLSNQFDKTNFKKAADFLVTPDEMKQAEKILSPEIKSALKTAFARIKSYHQKQLPTDFTFTDEQGVTLGNIWKNIESVGIYAPGGTASYPSSVLMSAVPALVAKVKNISMCVPTSAGQMNPAVLYAAKLCNIRDIYKIGGAQAIAALTYGTKTVKKVNKIVGPGNAYVAYAKKFLFGTVGIDMIAGPTDLTIIADKHNNAQWIAADALSQLEHGHDSKSFIITDNEDFAKEVVDEINKLAKTLQRKEIIAQSVKNSAIFIIEKLEDAPYLANFIAPEHLEIATKNALSLSRHIHNAGAIFLGSYTPEAIGDYMAGPSHTLPTSGSAKFSSGLSVYDFLKRISLISCNKDSFATLARETELLATCEGLDAHALSVTIRTKK